MNLDNVLYKHDHRGEERTKTVTLHSAYIMQDSIGGADLAVRQHCVQCITSNNKFSLHVLTEHLVNHMFTMLSIILTIG